MGTFRKFKNRIFLCSLAAGLIVWLVSLPVLGINVAFGYGLALGTCISIVNFNILAFFGKLLLSREKPGLAVMSMLVRFIIYGYAFYVAVKMSHVAGIGCIFGFMTQKIALFYIYGIRAKFSKDREVPEEVAKEYEELDEKRKKKRRKWEVW